MSRAGHLDQYHYLGLACNDEVVRILGLRQGVRILDVGCGIGGPARYLAWKTGCEVVGVDIQQQLVDAGNKVTRLVGLQDKVELISADVCDIQISNRFDAFISLLVILHIPNRDKLFSSLFSNLKSGGGFLIEDMVSLAPFDTEEERIAREVIGAPFLPNIDQYRADLEKAGFVDVEFEPLTSEWIQWCVDRSDQYMASKDAQIETYGEKIFEQRSSFYADVKRLFLSSRLGGVRITGRKPTDIEKAIRMHRHKRGVQQQSGCSASILEH
jgi:cyclopropane fatty-acyl-phospholipid synthase-like methyltransferase